MTCDFDFLQFEVHMRRRARLITAALLVLVACEAGDDSTSDIDASLPLTSVVCTDAPQLRQWSRDYRSQSDDVASDQRTITIGERANFFASLAIIADLKCRTTVVEADEALASALEAARKAQDAPNFYTTAVSWGRANFAAAQVIDLLVQNLPAPAAE
jgi:hypothetical protein